MPLARLRRIRRLDRNPAGRRRPAPRQPDGRGLRRIRRVGRCPGCERRGPGRPARARHRPDDDGRSGSEWRRRRRREYLGGQPRGQHGFPAQCTDRCGRADDPRRCRPSAVIEGFGSIWVTNSGARTLARIDESSGTVAATIRTDAVGRGVAVGGGAVWETNESTGRIVAVDPATNAVETRVNVGSGPTAITYGDGAVWVVKVTGRDGLALRPNASVRPHCSPSPFPATRSRSPSAATRCGWERLPAPVSSGLEPAGKPSAVRSRSGPASTPSRPPTAGCGLPLEPPASATAVGAGS